LTTEHTKKAQDKASKNSFSSKEICCALKWSITLRASQHGWFKQEFST